MQPVSKKIIPFIISLASLMQALDVTIINTAIPTMAAHLKVNPVDMKIALISYLMALAIFIPISGWVADKFGAKRVFTYALAIFTASSLWCGFAHNLLELIIARSVQGIGGAMMLPVGRLIIVRTFPRNKIVGVMNRVITIASIGSMLGPVIGGILTYYFSWSWIFWINIPIGLAAIVMIQHSLPDILQQETPPLDLLGFILFGGSLAGFTFGIALISQSTSYSLLATMIIAASILVFFLYIWHSRHQSYPIVKTALLRYRTFKTAISANLWARLGFSGIPFLVPLLLQVVLGYSSYESGLLVAPIAGGLLIAKQVSLPLLRVLGYKKLLIINTLFVGVSLWSLMLITQDTSIAMIVSLTFIFGFLTSIQYTGMNTLAYAGIATEDLSAATSIMSTLQQLSQSFGVAAAALCLHLFAASRTAAGSLLTTGTFQHTFFTLGVVTMISIIIFTALKPGDGLEMLVREAK
ncbi:MAG TPA: MFS transporter [Gammaproteobacteria bacterium]|nr:MFS transporter [Gammaproteobacteria bacterium]